MRVLVTGGAGYVGSHTAKALSQSGIEPVTLDDLSRGRRDAVRFGPLLVGNVADRALVRELISAQRLEAVVHFAGSIEAGESMRNPARYFENNFVATLALLDAVREAGVSRFVFSSTAAVYGIPEITPIAETAAQRPVNPYGESKLCVERALRWFGEAYGLRSVSLRYFNAAGADPEGELGECHDPETHLIPLVLRAALGEGEPLSVFGTDYPTPDGTALRDYVHVSDLARAHVLALRYLLDGGGSTALNLGTGRAHSVYEVISAAETVSGRPVPRREQARRAGDPPVLLADPSLALKTLGWTPSRPELHAIVTDAWRWHSLGRSVGSAK
jgi:UDP-arabinose 4-epimerase